MANEVAEKIRDMQIRGAVKIATSAVSELKRIADESSEEGFKSTSDLVKALFENAAELRSARPTAVSLPNAVDYAVNFIKENSNLNLDEFRVNFSNFCYNFIKEQNEAVERIGVKGCELISEGDVILTHCNSQSALSIIKKSHEKFPGISVISTETRPRNQGYITARQLSSTGVKTTFIVDSAVLRAMRKFRVKKVIVGADAVYERGILNKIGTCQVALCAKSMNIPFIVASQYLKFTKRSLEEIEVENRSPEEVTKESWIYEQGINVFNPAFDVTPKEYIDLIVTEEGYGSFEDVYSRWDSRKIIE